MVKFYLSRKHAIIKCENVTFFTRTIDMDYIDYNKIIPKDNDIFVTVERERLLSGLERANIIAEEKIQGSGKSFVSRIFAKLGYPVYFSDERAKMLYDTDKLLLEQIVELLGEDVLENGRINRAVMAGKIFGNGRRAAKRGHSS